MTTTTRPTIDEHDDITIEEIFEKQTHKHKDNTTSTHNQFIAIQFDDIDEEDEIVIEEDVEIQTNSTIDAAAGRGRNSNRRQRMKRREQLQHWVHDESVQLFDSQSSLEAANGINEGEHDKDETIQDDVDETDEHRFEISQVVKARSGRRVTFCNDYTTQYNTIIIITTTWLKSSTSDAIAINASSVFQKIASRLSIPLPSITITGSMFKLLAFIWSFGCICFHMFGTGRATRVAVVQG